MSKAPVRVAVTGAAGQIGYACCSASPAAKCSARTSRSSCSCSRSPTRRRRRRCKGVMMELDDCAFPLLHGMVPASDPMVAFKDADVALLVGARPRGPGMERKDLLEANGKIFGPQGQALDKVAEPRRQGAGGRQPGQHQLPDRDEERARASSPRSSPR